MYQKCLSLNPNTYILFFLGATWYSMHDYLAASSIIDIYINENTENNIYFY